MSHVVSPVGLSEYGRLSERPSPVNRMMSAFAEDFREGIDINLGVGYVNENTIPRDLVRGALDTVLSNPARYRAALNYGGPRGSLNLIRSIRSYISAHGLGGLTEEILSRKEIIIGANGATSLLEGIAQVVRRGIVVTTDPMYYIYSDCLERLGFRILAVPETPDGLSANAARDAIDALGPARQDLSFIYVVTVNNPTATILPNSQRRALVELGSRLSAELGRQIPVVFDKAYEELIHDPTVEAPLSGFIWDEAGIVYELGTLSKIVAPGLRIGYMIGADGPFMRAMVQRASDVGFSAPLVNQEIASVLLDKAIDAQVTRVKAGYREKALKVKEWIDQAMGPRLAGLTGGSASFYFYLTMKDIRTNEGSPFFRALARTTGSDEVDGPPERRRPRVIYIPGEFCVHPRGSMVEKGLRQLRISYGFEELSRLKDAVFLMAEAAEYARGRE